jgi:hypothetical protein
MSTQNQFAESLPRPHRLDSLDSAGAILIIRISFWTATAIAGFAQAWAVRFTINPDGNSYLDIASAYLRGDYANAVNAYWSPMYSWLIALTLRLLHPSPYWETALLHLLNFAGVLIALRCFEFFFSAFLEYLGRNQPKDDEPLLSVPGWWLLGYGLFLSTALFVLSLEPTNPDVWVCVVSYLAVGILLRIALYPLNWGYCAVFGVVLGLGYLTKAFYFPLSFIFLGGALLVGGMSRRSVARVAVAAVTFALVAGPFVFALSKAKHRLTYGDVGKIAYAMVVDPIQQPFSWHGENQSGTPRHPVRQILSSPRVIEFATPVAGAYPPVYDLSYWMEGVQLHFSVRGQLRILRQSIGTFFLIFLIQIEFAVGVLVLLLSKPRWRECGGSITRLWLLWLPPAIGCAAYALVLVENRYVAPFLPFLWLAAFAVALRNPSAASKRVRAAIVLGVLCIVGIKTAKYFVSDLAAMSHQENTNWLVAQNLRNIGLKPGERVAVIAGKAEGHWARLAEIKIVAELPLGQEGPFWEGDSALQGRVFAAFASTGARLVVVKEPPSGATKLGWQRLGDTPYYVHSLSGISLEQGRAQDSH